MEAVVLLQWTFDGLLGSTLLWLAWRTLASPNLFRAIVLFVAFGLLLALIWARLGAPDVALAEAAIGAGLTGSLLLAALARLQGNGNVAPDSDGEQPQEHNDSKDSLAARGETSGKHP